MTRNWRRALVLSVMVGGLAACDVVDAIGPGSGLAPRSLAGEYGWEFQRWDSGTARGYPVVNLTWEVPSQHGREVFRVYSRRSGGSYVLIATVSSCSGGVCRYTDTNVSSGQSYDYYVATYDDFDNTEHGSSQSIRVTAPARPALQTPGTPTTIALDGAVFLRWTSTGAHRYIIVAQPENGVQYIIGETDGLTFLDNRAQNGTRYRYHVAGVDAAGHVSALGSGADGVPRPDFHADVLYAHSDNPQASGFRFVANETQNPIVSGTSTEAQLRLEVVSGALRIQPLGQTTITAGTFTTQLTCGPGSDANCVDIRNAPSAASFGSSAVAVQTGNTYVLRVIASDNRPHYAKIRVQGPGVDGQGRRLIVFDWAYQLRPDDTRLNVTR
jgi:hypothetical protein